jgi:hypothetical protein
MDSESQESTRKKQKQSRNKRKTSEILRTERGLHASYQAPSRLRVRAGVAERERKREKERERERKREKERERERKSDNQQALHRSLVHTLITWCPTELVREHGWVNVIVRRGVNEVGDGTVASVTMCGDEAVSKPVDEQSTA